MAPAGSVAQRFARVEAAFRKDGFEVVRPPGCLLKDDRIGVLAEHRSARSAKTGAPKRACYVEGDGYHMGWLIGAMREPDVARMAGDFTDNVAFAFVGADSAAEEGALPRLKDLVVRIIALASERMLPDIPDEQVREIDGIVDGCRAANPSTRVRRERLLALNLGIDCLLAHIYTGRLFAERGVSPGMLRAPIGCNVFSLSGAAAGGKHFFGRDFMFPTADVYQDTACLIIHAPDDRPGSPCLPFVSQTAPGLVGTMAALNSAGLAVGVDMLPSSLSDPARPGLNSLLLIRDCVQSCPTAKDAVKRIQEAPRGVSWLYPVADAGGDAFIVEAGRRLGSREAFPLFDHVPAHYRRRLPGPAYIRRMRKRYGTPGPERGMIVRGREYRYPGSYIQDWNEGLWHAYMSSWITVLLGLLKLRSAAAESRRGELRSLLAGRDFSPEMFAERGFVNSSWKGRNCPGPFYFAPQREDRPDVLLATNHCITPEMRLTSMNEWIALLTGANQNEIQWRYDELNRQILDALDRMPAGVDAPTAWRLIDFLRPDGMFPEFYNPGGALDWRRVQVHGSVTLCELTGRTLTSLFGYYGDEAVTISLSRYLP